MPTSSRYLPDTNFWLALLLGGHPSQRIAGEWLRGLEPGSSLWLCESTRQSVLRLLTTAAVFAPYAMEPLSNRVAWETLERLQTDPRVNLAPDPPAGLDEIWRRFGAHELSSPKLWMDAYLAAFAIAGGFRLLTLDRGFRQFPGLDPVILEMRSRSVLGA